MNMEPYPDNLSEDGPTTLEPRKLNAEIASNSFTFISSLGGAAFLGYFEATSSIPSTLDAFSAEQTGEALMMGSTSVVLAGAMWGLGFAAQITGDHMKQLFLNKRFVAVMKKEGLDQQPNS